MIYKYMHFVSVAVRCFGSIVSGVSENRYLDRTYTKGTAQPVNADKSESCL